MSRTRKFCLILDLAAFLGLGLFLLACYYREPRPAWSVEVSPGAAVLGYMAQERHVLILHNADVRGSQLPRPRLQRWSVETGQCLSDYPVQVPEQELALALPASPGAVRQCFWGSLSQEPPTLALHQELGEQQALLRLYDPSSGRSLTDSPERLNWETYCHGMQRADGHFLGIFLRSVKHYPESSLVVRDLTTSAQIRVLRPEPAESFTTAAFLTMGEFVAAVTRIKTPAASRWHYFLYIFRTGDGKAVVHHDLGEWATQERYGFDLQPLERNEFHLYCLASFREQPGQMIIERFRFDAQTHALNTTTDPTNYGRMREGLYRIQRNLVWRMRHHDQAWWQQSRWDWLTSGLNRCGISLPTTDKLLNYDVFDFQSGGLLRRCTGLSVNPPHVSEDGTLLVGIEDSDPAHPRVVAFPLRHYLWEYSWITLKYAAWLLILPWPLRIYAARAERRAGGT